MADPATFLTTTLVGNNIALVVYSTLMSLALEAPLTRCATRSALANRPAWVLVDRRRSSPRSSCCVLGEVIPKSLLREPPDRVPSSRWRVRSS